MTERELTGGEIRELANLEISKWSERFWTIGHRH